MLLAPPIISQAAKVFTRFYSFFILFTEKASVIVTARGSPSGTATTMIVTPIIKALTTNYRKGMVSNPFSHC
jgi:ribosomal protein L14